LVPANQSKPDIVAAGGKQAQMLHYCVMSKQPETDGLPSAMSVVNDVSVNDFADCCLQTKNFWQTLLRCVHKHLMLAPLYRTVDYNSHFSCIRLCLNYRITTSSSQPNEKARTVLPRLKIKSWI